MNLFPVTRFLYKNFNLYAIYNIMKILSIETSCDETALSILEAEGSFDNLIK